ncbi:MAG TPA: 2-succinyl-6-hydroxy-2,4-cyclohexadiene-1-carboxylate synthase [bacterium]|nr:2-succinyl-6-hydroxy-2,4-cyclohexadiene-1-carboxylate synthase [bacterium]
MARLPVNGVALNVETAGSGPALVLLHGFTGAAGSWAAHLPALSACCSTVAIDMLGHGASDAPAEPSRYGIEHVAADVLAVLDRLGIGRAAVLGYSMGGRAALFLATMAPERVTALILESASPGIADAASRAARAAQDVELADAIERDGVPAFVDRWERLPLFATQAGLPAEVRAAARAQRIAQSPRGLANSLRGLGQGAQPALFDRLGALPMPVLLIAGECDERYAALGLTMRRAIPDARVVVVPAAGHTVHLEQPEAFQRAVLDFLRSVEDGDAARRRCGDGMADRA